MGKMYFAKMNINEDIYEVYNGQKNLDELVKKIFINILPKTKVYDDKGGRFKFFGLEY